MTEDCLDLYSMLSPVPKKNLLVEEDYHIWCGCLIEGYDGKYHYYYSRWPKEMGHYAWVTDSEIAYAVSDTPDGPFRKMGTILGKRSLTFWDGAAVHNPQVIKWNGKYYLYHMGTTCERAISYPASAKEAAWWEYRNNQKIGVAVASDPSGPWQRLDSPILDKSADPAAFDALCVTNPAPVVTPDGKILLIYKGVSDGNLPYGASVRYGVAAAERPEGPYQKYPGCIFEQKDGTQKVRMAAEDPFVMVYHGLYYAVTRDVEGIFTGIKGAFCLFVSKDGVNWEIASHPLVYGTETTWADGSKTQGQLERPFVLQDRNGEPIMLLGAITTQTDTEGKRLHSGSLRVPLKRK